MAESILVTGKKISSMELVTNVTGNEKIPTGQPDDLAVTPNQIADHTIARGSLVNRGDLLQVEGDLGTQIEDLVRDLAAEESARIAADSLKVDKEGSVSSVADRVGDVVLAPSDVLVEGFGSQEAVNKYVPKPFLSGYTYGLGERVVLDDGEVVKSLVEGNVSDPNVDMIGWVSAISDSLSDTIQTFNTPEAGVDPVTGVPSGAYYNVRSSDEDNFLEEYQNIGGVPTPTGKYCPSVNSVVQLIANIDALRSYKGGKNKQQIRTLEYHNGSGYGGALYQWDSSSNADDDGFSVIAVTGVSTGRWNLVIKNRTVDAFCGGVHTDLAIGTTTELQAVIDYMSASGGGKVTLPPVTIAANIKGKSNVTLEGSVLAGTMYTPATKIISQGSGQNIQAIEPCFKARYLELDGRNSVGTQRASYNLAVAADDFEGFAIVGSYARFDGIYVNNASKNAVIEHSEFKHVSRNVGSLVSCSNVTFNHCKFIEDSNIVTGLYLFDVEPDAPNEVYDVFFNYCEFNKVNITYNSSVILKHTTSPLNSMNVKFNHCAFRGYTSIRINSNDFVGLYLEYTFFESSGFSGISTVSNNIKSGHAKGCYFNALSIGTTFGYQTRFGGDFVFDENIFNINPSTAAINGATWCANTFNAGITPVSPVDRRSVTAQYRDRTMLELVNDPAGALAAHNITEVRQVNLSTTPTPILTAKTRSTAIVTVAAADASAGGSLGLVELVISSDDTASNTFATDKINGSRGITYSWDGRTLSLATKAAAANQWVVKVETFAVNAFYRQVTWLV